MTTHGDISSSESAEQLLSKSVVIIGGAASGIATAKALQGTGVKVTIIQAVPYWEKQVAAPFILTCPETHEEYVEPLEANELPGVSYIVGMVISMESDHVIIEGGKRCYFDACVIAVGWSCGLLKPQLGESLSSRSDTVRRVGAAIRAASSVVIVGGGPVGVELAEQIRDVNLTAKVSVVCRNGLLPSFDAQTRERMMKTLQELDVGILNDELNCDVSSLTPRTYEMKSGFTIEADVLLIAYGTLQTGFLAPGLVDRMGNVVVNEFMQCLTEPKLFAVGCTNLNKFRSIPEIEEQAKVAALSMVRFLKFQAKPQRERQSAVHRRSVRRDKDTSTSKALQKNAKFRQQRCSSDRSHLYLNSLD